MHTHRTAQPADPPAFARMRVPEAWARYDARLTWGMGQTLALLDDGCDMGEPAWQASLPWGRKVIATWDAIDRKEDPSHGPVGYHGTTIGFPSSRNHGGLIGVAYNNFVAIVRCVSIVHLVQDESRSVADALEWVIEHRQRLNITAVNLAPVDDKPHPGPAATAIDGPLARLRQLGVWVSAPCANNEYTTGISWPACAEGCFAIGATDPETGRVHRDRWSNTDLLAPATATSSSNAFACAGAMILREAVEKTGYRWHDEAATLPEALMRIMQRTGPRAHDPATGLTFPCLDLLAALDAVFEG
jgi:hypothetical protein